MNGIRGHPKSPFYAHHVNQNFGISQKKINSMDLTSGFILLSRSLRKSDIFQNEKWLKVWIWCLIKANHQGKKVPIKTGIGETVVSVERGQFIFGRNKASEELNMSPSTVRNIFDKLEKLGNLDRQVDNHFSIITIRDYCIYQNPESYKGQTSGQPKDNQRTTKGQPKDTNNNDNTLNNDKNDKNDNINTTPLIKEIIESLNLKAGTKYKHTSNKTKGCITARINEGFGLNDFLTVIDKKVKEWSNTDMEKYLRPETLFGNKFEGYLNQRIKQNYGKSIGDILNEGIPGIDDTGEETCYKQSGFDDNIIEIYQTD